MKNNKVPRGYASAIYDERCALGNMMATRHESNITERRHEHTAYVASHGVLTCMAVIAAALLLNAIGDGAVNATAVSGLRCRRLSADAMATNTLRPCSIEPAMVINIYRQQSVGSIRESRTGRHANIERLIW